MNVYYQKKSLQDILSTFPTSDSLGLVPTMGALHEGHISLVEKALAENDHVVVSIFVNPTQFDNAGDLTKYPRTLDEDVALLKKTSPNILVFAPSPNEIYGATIASKKYRFGSLEKAMEGKHRNGHFDGVGTVLNLLFRIVKPTKAYFGEKDFQQLQIVRKLVAIEALPVHIVGCPILRESHGLAMSSRNKRLSQALFKEAGIIYKMLKHVKDNFKSQSIQELTESVQTVFENHPHLELEYFEIANTKNLKTAQRKRKNNTYRAFVAAYAGEVRLIDNIALN